MDPKLLFVIVYIIVDIIYITLSSSYYLGVFAKIQHGDSISFNDDSLRYVGILGAYMAMAIGWYYLAAGLANTWIAEKRFSSPYIAGLLAGAIFGFSVYGTYNFTNYVSLKNYDTGILMRDLTWGTTWGALSVMLYTVYITNNK